MDDVSLHIGSGETYGMLGPNRAGSTITFSIVAGVLGADGGEVTVAGQPSNPSEIRARAAIGLVPGIWPWRAVGLRSGVGAATRALVATVGPWETGPTCRSGPAG